MWLAGAATLVVAIGLALLFGRPIVAAAAQFPAARLSMLLLGIAMIIAAWLAASAPTAAARAVVTPLLGIAVVAPLFVGWTDGPIVIRVVARSAGVFLVPLVLHLLVTGLSPILRRRMRVALWIAYGSAGAAAGIILVARNAFYDIRCWADCGIPPLVTAVPPWLARAGPDLELGVAIVGLVAGIVAVAFGLVRARGFEAPAIALSAVTTLALLVASATAAASYRPSSALQAPDATGLAIATSTALTVLAICVGVASAGLSARARRVEHLAEELGRLSDAGSVESALGQLLGDDTLHIRFPFGADGATIDSFGRPADAEAAANRTRVEIRRGGTAIAYLDAAAGRVNVRSISEGIGSASRIAIDNERLRAEILAHLRELRQSRERIVEAADIQRRHTEQDLHDGAQSGLVGLLYTLTARSRSRGPDWEPEDVELLDDTASALRELVGSVRGIAHGVYPADLANTGLEEAVRSLIGRSPVAAELVIAMDARPPARVERLAYFVTKRLLEAADDPIGLTIACTPDRLTMTCRGRALPDGIDDRVAAVSGTLQIVDGDMIVMEVPCG